MRYRIAFVFLMTIPTITILILLGWGMYTYEMKFIRGALTIVQFCVVIGLPFLAFLWAAITLTNSDERKAKRK